MKTHRTPPPTETGGYRAVTDGDLRDGMDLREFLLGLGIVMRLPGKQRENAARKAAIEPKTDEPKAPKGGGPRGRIVPVATVLAGIVAIAVTLPIVIPDRSDALPTALVGTWHTPAPKYADRAFEIREGTLRLQRGPASTDVAVLPIQRIRVTPRGSSTAVRIDYLENGVTQSLDLTMHGSGAETAVELSNQAEVIWRKERSASGPQFPPEVLLPPGASSTPTRR